MKAHGFDEGGSPESGEGGHDTMWFAVRDLLFGKDAYPLPVVPESLARPELGRLMPQIPVPQEQLILLLMNVLMIEIRAEAFFSFCMRLMRAPELFSDRRADAEQAAVLVERIRQDEAIHVAYLQTAVSELRSFTFRAESGASVPGKAFIDPVWNGMVQWHSVTTVDHARAQARDAIVAQLASAPDGARRLAAFDALASPGGGVMRALAGKAAFVTGGASGIGLALGRAFAASGMKVMLADIEAAPLETAVRQLAGTNAEVKGLVCDVSDRAARRACGGGHIRRLRQGPCRLQQCRRRRRAARSSRSRRPIGTGPSAST